MTDATSTRPGLVDHPCHVCGNPVAPFGFGWPGPRSKHRDDTILWACGEHREEVERINGIRIGLQPERPRAPKQAGPSRQVRQGERSFGLLPPKRNKRGRVLGCACGPRHPRRFRFPPHLSTLAARAGVRRA